MSADYFQEIEAHFASRRRTPYILNAKDWALMQEWAAAGIPLPVVIEAVDSVFDKREAAGKSVSSLSYCKHAIKEMWKERQALAVGGEENPPEVDPASALDALALAIESSAAASFAPRVRALATLRSLPRIEEALMTLEEELVSSLATPSLRDEAAALVPSGEQRAIAAHVRRLVRERYELPRLTVM
ncbi:MAG TPA: hypothetical protein VM733_13775 [Thermoanaerobaculia bacterium]|nr:hypothetical protein [Thermoanaerobaculia bacterium]